MKTKYFFTPALLSAIAFMAFCLMACGDSVENVNQIGMEVVDSAGDLPGCTQENEGEQAFVKEDSSIRTCINGKWNGKSSNFACKTEELKDKSGVKVVCNGDSVTVIKNGAKGKNGSVGEDCKITAQTDSSVTIDCAGELSIIKLGNPNKEVQHDSESVTTSMDSLVGYTQKGPFLKGSTVYLYELESGRTLKQTNGNFTSNIPRDDGRYKFVARDLVSQYAMIIVDGNYRNEVTGNVSTNTIRLKALSDLSKHTSVNVNILSHLEFERVYRLVTKEKKKVYASKQQAQEEILNLFDIKLKDKTDAEEMNVFGNTEADAALLAISILLQGNRTEAELMALLAEISDEIAERGEWEGNRADSLKAAFADWAFTKDMSIIREKVEGWGLNNGNPVGNFEKMIENYIMKTYGLEPCGDKDNGKERTINNKWSVNNGKTYYCNEGKAIVKRAPKNLNPGIEYGEIIDYRDRKPYKTVEIKGQKEIKTWMAENLDYDYRVKGVTYGTFFYTHENGVTERYYTWGATMDSAAIFSDKSKWCGQGYNTCTIKYPARGICPEGWHVPTIYEWEDLYYGLYYDLYDAAGSVDAAYKAAANATQAKGYEGWPDAVNTTGFSVLPVGSYDFELNTDIEGTFNNIGTQASFWSSSEQGSTQFAGNWNVYTDKADDYTILKMSGNSVRCVKD